MSVAASAASISNSVNSFSGIERWAVLSRGFTDSLILKIDCSRPLQRNFLKWSWKILFNSAGDVRKDALYLIFLIALEELHLAIALWKFFVFFSPFNC